MLDSRVRHTTHSMNSALECASQLGRWCWGPRAATPWAVNRYRTWLCKRLWTDVSSGPGGVGEGRAGVRFGAGFRAERGQGCRRRASVPPRPRRRHGGIRPRHFCAGGRGRRLCHFPGGPRLELPRVAPDTLSTPSSLPRFSSTARSTTGGPSARRRRRCAPTARRSSPRTAGTAHDVTEPGPPPKLPTVAEARGGPGDHRKGGSDDMPWFVAILTACACACAMFGFCTRMCHGSASVRHGL